jgi:hypothetical protein
MGHTMIEMGRLYSHLAPDAVCAGCLSLHVRSRGEDRGARHLFLNLKLDCSHTLYIL